jgi:uncharacterized membrane protein YbhN (UPF0104 family)
MEDQYSWLALGCRRAMAAIAETLGVSVQAIILGLCLRAFGHHATMAELLLVNTIATLLAGFMPVPGGMGVADAAYTTGLVALGVPNATAMSTPPPSGWSPTTFHRSGARSPCAGCDSTRT